ncbi:MAG: glycoside hydrolase family 31 protein [Cyclobacteriaceae bacterium]
MNVSAEMKNIIGISLLLGSLFSCSNSNFENSVTYVKIDSGLKVNIDSTNVEIRFYSPSIVRITKSPEENYDKESLSVVKKPEAVAYEVEESDNTISLVTEELALSIDKNTGAISYSLPDGNKILKEKESGVTFEPFLDLDDSTYSVGQAFTLDAEEAIYGLGILQNGKMSQRNQVVRMVQNNTWDFVPFFQSVKGYGIFWDNYSPTVFKDDQDGTQFQSEVGHGIDYYFMYGGSADAVVAEMRDLTGQAPMFPLWTYGFWQSKERYKSQKETIGVVKKYRELGVPIDGIIQDWQYWGDNYHWNAMNFLNPNFPNPQEFINQVHDQNAHIIISIWSSFGPETKPFQELKANDMLLDFPTWPLSGKDTWPPDMNYPSGVQVYDAYDPAARDIYWKYLDNGLFTLGIDGWWMDSTEPDHLNAKDEDLNNDTYLGSFRKVRNAYPLMSVGGVYDHQREKTSDKRVFILTRSAFAGQQRYAANTWSGDVVASWSALRNQISAGLNFSLTGIPYFNSDIGGFFLWDFPKKLEDPEYRELYARWLEFGAFCPMMRSHGADAPREIYQFGKKGDEIYNAIEKFIKLRYSLLPYIYSTSWKVTSEQYSMMRALSMDFVSDPKTHDINDQFLFGSSIMVAPVTQPMYFREVIANGDTTNVEDFEAVKAKEVYLPKGSDWYDFWTNEKLDGGQMISKKSPIDIIPLYIKSGSILPIGPDVQYAEEKDWSELEIRIYTGTDGTFELYEDENDSYNYEKGAYSITRFAWIQNEKQLTIDKREGSFSGMLEDRIFNVTFINDHGKSVSKTVKYEGEQITVKP